MPSLHPGYEYDIFISYRQNDNRSGWVTEFVKALQEELGTTIKEPVSVYFDTNPYDGLLETHNVDKSLEGKLKCITFIPILSQTYCDPKSFAWQHEFCAFNKMAKAEPVGRDIKISNGNVASRILPVKIHDLDHEDKALLESELGGVLRAVEFIFTSSGVNRPLRAAEDHPQANLNKTFYRDQVNKVANAVKPIISSIMSPGRQVPGSTPRHRLEAPKPKRRTQLAIASAFILLLSILGLLIYPKFIPAEEADLGDSIAVLYFDNISSDPEQDYFSDGITEEITAHLSSIKGLRVTSRTSVIPYKGKGKAINVREIGRQLNVGIILEGSVRKSGNKLRITAQLIDARTDQHIWTEVYDRDLTDIFKIQSEIAHAIADKFKVAISKEADERIASIPTTNIKAYELYLKARAIPWGTGDGIGTYFGGMNQAKEWLKEAIALDPDFSLPYAHLSRLYRYFNRDSAEFFAREAIIRNPRSADGFIALAELQDFENALKLLRKACPLDSMTVLLSMAELYSSHGKLAEVIRIGSYLIKSNPNVVDAYLVKANVYSFLAQPDSTEKYLAIVNELAPNSREVYRILSDISVNLGKIEDTKRHAPKYYGDDTLSANKVIGISCIMAKDWEQAYIYYSRTNYRDMDWGLVLIRLGRKEEGKKALRESLAYREKNGGWDGDFSRINILLGNKALGLEYLSKLIDSSWLGLDFFRNDPYWDELRQDPEFKKLADKIERGNLEMLRRIKVDEKKEFSLDF